MILNKIIIALLILLPAKTAFATNDPAWTADKTRLEKLVSEEKCDQYWNLLWPWAKKDNIEARQTLFLISAVQLHMPEVYPPGRSGDLVTHLRDILILAIHGLPEKNSPDFAFVDYIKIADSFIPHYPTASNAENFLKCWKEQQTQDCTKIAVRDGFIPSWSSYTTEIDALIDKGMKSTCIK